MRGVAVHFAWSPADAAKPLTSYKENPTKSAAQYFRHITRNLSNNSDRFAELQQSDGNLLQSSNGVKVWAYPKIHLLLEAVEEAYIQITH